MSGSIVQSGRSVDDSGGTSTTVAVTLTGVTAGNALVAFLGWEDGSGSITASASDGSSLPSAAAKVRLTADTQGGQIFSRGNVASGSHTVTCTLSTSTGFRRLRVVEVAGLDTSATVDKATGAAQTPGGTGAGAVSSGATAATTNANDFVMGFSQDTLEVNPGTGTVTAGSGYVISGTDVLMSIESKSVSATGTQTATFTQSVNNNRITHVVAFNEAAASGAIAGTAGITFSGSGSLTGDGALTGTAALAFGQSGTLTGSGALSGSAALTFGQTGNLAGTGALAGSAALSFGQTGALTGAGALAGTAPLTFGQTGALAGDGALAGSGAIIFNATGTLNQPSGAMAGTAAIVFGASGTLTGDGVLSGTGAIMFNAAGSLDSGLEPVDTHDPIWNRNAQTQVIRESELKRNLEKLHGKKPKKAEPVAKVAEPAKIVAKPDEDGVILAALITQEDERMLNLVEQALNLLKTLH